MNTVKQKGRKLPQQPQPLNTNKSDYLTITELSELLKMSISHIYTLTSTKKIPHIKVLGKKILFDRKEIIKWVKSKSILIS